MSHKYTWKYNFRFVDAERKNFKLIFFAVLVGLIVGLMGAIFRQSLNYIETFRATLLSDVSKEDMLSWIWPVVLTVAGAGISIYLVKRFAPETSGSGVQEIEGALDNIRPLRWKRVLPVKFIASLFSLGSGFLLGREGPTIQIGANIGKMIRDLFKQSESKNNPLISAGAAAGLASAFNAPFSGIVFVMEEMHDHFKYSFFSLAAIMVASATADLVVRLLIGSHPVIQMMVYKAPDISAIWMFIVLGLIFALVGYIFNKLLLTTLDFFKMLPSYGAKLAILLVSISIAMIGIFYPDMIGGGYDTIRHALDHSFSLQMLLIIFVVRMLMTVFSYGIGLPGGIFAPMLALGVVLGMLFGGIMEQWFPGQIVAPGVFAVAGMAAMFASTVRAPITGMILAVEMTANYELLLPLIFTVVTASLVTTQLGNKPIYTILLRRTMQMQKDKVQSSTSA
jgi:CIC family chloride channel protein